MTEAAREGAQPPPAVVGIDAFRRVDFNVTLAAVTVVDCDALGEQFEAAAQNALGDEEALSVYRVLGGVAGFHFTPDSKSGPFGPMLTLGDGRRSAIPDDYRGAQNDVLAELAADVGHPGLRARIADVVWLNDRKRRSAADAAVEAYCECVEAVRDGRMAHRFGSPHTVPNRSIELLHRALQISSRTRKDCAVAARTANLVKTLADVAETAKEQHGFERLAYLARRFDIIAANVIAPRAEALANLRTNDPLASKALFEAAARAYEQAGDMVSHDRCALASAEELVRMADGMDSAGASAGWIMDAIQELRSLKGTKDRRKELEGRLRELQHDALDEMGSFFIPLDLKEAIANTEEAFEGVTLPDALMMLARIAVSRPLDDLRAEANKGLADSPLQAILTETHIDGADGKLIAKGEGASFGKAQSEEWYERQICHNEKLHRQIIVAAQFEPARQIIAESFPLSERHFASVSQMSPFVPPGHEHLFALGFAQMMRADYASACHLLLPQLENSLRYVLKQRGVDPTMIQSDMVQEDRTLSVLLTDERQTLDATLGANLAAEIDRLFNSRFGPALRHVYAHGKLSVGACYSPDGIYSCWLIYRITCLPLLPRWSDLVAPAIIAATM
jgi:hypothetical protein